MSLHHTDSLHSELREELARILSIEPHEISGDDDLFDMGLDSVGLIRLVTLWRGQGFDPSFETLSATPTLDTWSRILLDSRQAAIAPATDSLPEADVDGSYVMPAMTTMQHAYWVGRQPGQDVGGVSAHFYAEFDGAHIEPDRLQAALRVLADRHDSLRMVFGADATVTVRPRGTAPRLHVHDFRSAGAATTEAALASLREAGSHRRLDVAAGEVLRVELSLLPDEMTRLHLDLDMLVADAVSMRILLADLTRIYREPTIVLPPLQRSLLAEVTARVESAATCRSSSGGSADWWRGRLSELPGAPALPITNTSEAPRSVRLHHWLDADAQRTLTERARSAGLTVSALLLTVFAEVVAAWSADHRFLLNLPVFDRSSAPGAEDLVGDFSSSILLDVDLTAELPLADHARLLQEQMRKALMHRDYSGVDVLRDLTRANGGVAVLAPVVYTSALGLGELYPDAVREVLGQPSWIVSQGPQVWLDAQVTELGGGILLNWDVRVDLLPQAFARHAFDAYLGLIAALTEGSLDLQTRPVSTLTPADTVLERERQYLPTPPLPLPRLHDGFSACARLTPDAPALITDTSVTSYGTLARRVASIAAALVDRGVGPGARVAIRMPKSPDQIAAALAVLTVGGAYVPVNPAHPVARQQAICDTAAAVCLIVDAESVAEPALDAVPILDITTLPTPGPESPRWWPDVDPDGAAYVLFTSGSTGTPKGVEVSHRAAMTTLNTLVKRFGISAADCTFGIAALDFDMSVFDTFAALSVGGAVVLPSETQRTDPSAWVKLVRAHGVTVWNSVPSLLQLLIDTDSSMYADAPPLPLRTALVGGDRVRTELAAAVRAAVPDCRFAALGGMTEAAIHSTVLEVDEVLPEWDEVPWGAPLDGVRCRIVDGRGRDAPDGVPGELWVGGAALALGYCNDEMRTAERFVRLDGARWYRTGDRARYLRDADGAPCIHFLGRGDGQVKIRGHRVELGEVESALRAHPDVDLAVAAVIDDRLVAMVTGSTAMEVLREHQQELLPEYMVCNRILTVGSIPLSANGKHDRKAVHQILSAWLSERGTDSGAEAERPRGEIETLVAGIWAETLGVDVYRGDSFFALGGDSLSAARVITALWRRGIQCSIGDLFGSPRLADFCDSAERTDPQARTEIVPQPQHRYEPFDLTAVQQAYVTGRDPRWGLGGVGTYHYTEFDGEDLDVERFLGAWDTLVDRHDMLRCVIVDGRGQVLPSGQAPRFDYRDITTGEANLHSALDQFREQHSHNLIDDGMPVTLAGIRYRTADGQVRTRLGIGIDFAMLDARSIIILYTELETLYRDPGHVFEELHLTFRDCVTIEPEPNQVSTALEHWRGRLHELPPAPALPLTRSLDDVSGHRFRRRTQPFGADWYARLTARCRTHGVTPSLALLEAYMLVLAKWSGQDALSVTMTVFDRKGNHPEIHNILGDFTSLTLIDHVAAPQAAFADSLRQMQQRFGRDLEHLTVSPLRVRRSVQEDEVDTVGVPVVFTSSLGVGDGLSPGLSGSYGEQIYGVTQSPQVILDNQVIETETGVQINWDCVDEVFPTGLLDDMFAAYVTYLTALVELDWDQTIPIPIPDYQRQSRANVNATATDRPQATLHSAFFERALAVPDRTALICLSGAESSEDAMSMTYRELRLAALRIGQGLRDRGVTAGDLVAVTIPKSVEQIACVLGVLAVGAVYVPVGAPHPSARRHRIYTDAGVRFVVTADSAVAQAAAEDTAIDSCTAEELSGAAELGELHPTDPSELAYVIYTSGSTGTPKGVQITHDAAWSTVDAVNRLYGVSEQDRALALSALDFDLSVYDVFGLLALGGAVVIPTEDDRRDANSWVDAVQSHGVTLWNSVPTLVEMLILAAQRSDTSLPTLRLVLVSGDWVSTDLAIRLAGVTGAGCRLVALGGATEAAIWSNHFPVAQLPAGSPSVPYGYPLADQSFRVLGPNGDCPDWVPGELVIGGRGVAQGYRHDAERSAAAFPVLDGVRSYRTGDLGRYLPGGVLEFLGRRDTQVKVGGYRIELAEIETALATSPEVTRSVAVVAETGTGARYLHAFVESAQETRGPALVRRILDTAGTLLPTYAVPADLTVVDMWPLTANGKIDRAALTTRASAAQESAGELQLTETAQAIADLFAGYGVVVSGADSSFFAGGGDSVQALRLLTDIETRWHIRVDIRRFLAEPTVRRLTSEVERAREDTENNLEEFYESGVL